MHWKELTTSSGPFSAKKLSEKAGPKVPEGPLVVIVGKKPPAALNDDETPNPFFQKTADVMEAQVRPRESSANPGVIVKDQFRQAYHLGHERYRLFPRRGSM